MTTYIIINLIKKISVMKKNSILVLFLSFIMIGFTSCSKKDNSATTSSLDAGTEQTITDITIHFTASQTGDGAISTLTYTVGSASQTVTNPTLPWSVSVDANAGDNISMTATAITTNGSVKIEYDGSNATETIHGEDSCSTSSSK